MTEAEAEGAREAAVATALAWAWRVPGMPAARRSATCRLALLVHMPSRFASVWEARSDLSCSVYTMCSRTHARTLAAASATEVQRPTSSRLSAATAG